MSPMTRTRATEGDVATDLIGDRYVQRASAGPIIPNAPICPTRARGYARARHSPARPGRGIGARWRTGSACGSRHPASSMEYTATTNWPGSATSCGRWTSSEPVIYNCCESNAKALESGKVQIEHVAGTFRQLTSAPIIVNGGFNRADAALAADYADLVSVGIPCFAGADQVERLRAGAALDKRDPSIFNAAGSRGFTGHPALPGRMSIAGDGQLRWLRSVR